MTPGLVHVIITIIVENGSNHRTGESESWYKREKKSLSSLVLIIFSIGDHIFFFFFTLLHWRGQLSLLFLWVYLTVTAVCVELHGRFTVRRRLLQIASLSFLTAAPMALGCIVLGHGPMKWKGKQCCADITLMLQFVHGDSAVEMGTNAHEHIHSFKLLSAVLV